MTANASELLAWFKKTFPDKAATADNVVDYVMTNLVVCVKAHTPGSPLRGVGGFPTLFYAAFFPAASSLRSSWASLASSSPRLWSASSPIHTNAPPPGLCGPSLSSSPHLLPPVLPAIFQRVRWS